MYTHYNSVGTIPTDSLISAVGGVYPVIAHIYFCTLCSTLFIVVKTSTHTYMLIHRYAIHFTVYVYFEMTYVHMYIHTCSLKNSWFWLQHRNVSHVNAFKHSGADGCSRSTIDSKNFSHSNISPVNSCWDHCFFSLIARTSSSTSSPYIEKYVHHLTLWSLTYNKHHATQNNCSQNLHV